MRGVLVLALLQVMAGAAHACRFARDAQPAQWDEWSSALFAGDVTSVELDKDAMDVITVRVVETFKGPEGAAATLRVPSRMWASCLLERPRVGAHVLVALNPNRDTLLVPLEPGYRERLRQHLGKRAPAPPARSGEKPFHY